MDSHQTVNLLNYVESQQNLNMTPPQEESTAKANAGNEGLQDTANGGRDRLASTAELGTSIDDGVKLSVDATKTLPMRERPTGDPPTGKAIEQRREGGLGGGPF